MSMLEVHNESSILLSMGVVVETLIRMSTLQPWVENYSRLALTVIFSYNRGNVCINILDGINALLERVGRSKRCCSGSNT